MTGLNTCVRKLCELDALVFQITNWLMHNTREDCVTEETIHAFFLDRRPLDT